MPVETRFSPPRPGGVHKGAVQQAILRLPRHREGAAQTIHFAPIPDQRDGTATVPLAARSDAGMPVDFSVREGPAYVCDGMVHLTPVPPRARMPVRVTVTAWQFGRGSEPKVQAAVPVERAFWLIR